jgi:serine/threonine protein phosphatase PrpC
MSTNPPPPSSRRSLRPITLAKSASSSQSYEQDPDLALALAVSLVNDGKGPSPKLSLTGMKKKKKRQRANSDGKTNHDERDDKVLLHSESIIIGETSKSDLEHELQAKPILDSHSSVILPKSLQTTDLFSISTLIPDDVLSQEIESTTEHANLDLMVDAISNNSRAVDIPLPLVSNKSIIDSSFTGIVPDILSQEFEESAVEESALLRPDIVSSNEQRLLAYQELCSSYIEVPDILSQEFEIVTNEESTTIVQHLIPSNERPSTQSIIDLSFSGPIDILSQEFSNHNQSSDECIVMKEESSTSLSINGSLIPQNEKLENRLYPEELNDLDSTSISISTTTSQNLCLQKTRLSTENDVAVSINEESPTSTSTSSSSSLDTVTLFGQALVSRLTQRPRSVRMFASQHPANSPCEDFLYAGSNAEYTPSSTTNSVSPIDLAYIFLVLDGHGGPVAASFGVTHLPGKIFEKTSNAKDTFSVVTGIKEAFEEVDKMYLSTHSNDLNYCKFGSCVNLVLLRKVLLPTTLPIQSSDSIESKSPSLPRWTIFTANVGDSRSVLSSQWDVTRYGQESLSCLVPSARSQLIDSRVHNRSADAAGIPSLLAASRISVPDRPVDVIKVVNECETSVVTSVLQERSYGKGNVSSTIYRNKAECFDLHAKCIAYSVIGDTVSTSSLSPLQIAKEQCRKMLNTNNTVAIPLSVDHTCANPLEADDVKARCWDKTPIRPNIFGFNPTFINRGEESLTSTPSSLISRSTSLKAGTNGIMSQSPKEYDISMHRVAGSLMVTRALGDHYLKSSLHSPPLFSSGCPYISCEPEVHWRVLQPQDMFALMGCDGIWDNVTNAEAIEIVTIALQNEALQPILETLNKNLNELQTEGEDGGTDIGTDTGAETGPEATKHFTTATAALSDVLLVDTLGSPIPVCLGMSSLPILNSSTSATDKNNSTVTLGIENIEDVVFGNPAQRIVGASLLVAASRHVESAKRLWHTNISLEASVSQLLAKSPKVSDPKQKNHRRGIHDDLSALVILLPQFMIDENQAADKSCYKDDTTIETIQSCAMEGVDLFIFSSPSTRFTKESIDAQLDMRIQSRSGRTVKGVSDVEPYVDNSDRLVQSQSKSSLLSWLKKPV